MQISQVKYPKTSDEARQYAINWQNWASEQSLSYSEIIEWQIFWEKVGEEFNLLDEYKENGII
jgi:hypothetical protein